MSPKKTRRGGKYTTGIKKTPSGGYGGQTTGRRGCFSMVLAVAMIVVVAALAACEPEAVPKQGRGMRTPAVPEVNMANVKSLCDYVSTFVDSPDARGNVGLRAEMSGVPRELKTKAVAYGRNPTPDAQRVVLLQCATLGWSR